MSEKEIIRVIDLTAQYGDIVIIKDLSVGFKEGLITCIVGPSGCGKSTLLKSIVGLLKPQKGKVLVDGYDLSSLEGDELDTVLSRIGLLFQQGAMLNSISVAENVALPIREHTDLPPPIIEQIVKLKLETVGLGNAGHKLPSELSGGMRKRAALARAMALDPKILLCDEPSAGLDPQTQAGLDDLIIKLKETFKMTVIVVTHELASIERIADDIVMLGKGGVMHFHGNIYQAKESQIPEVRDFFERRLPDQRVGSLSLYESLFR